MNVIGLGMSETFKEAGERLSKEISSRGNLDKVELMPDAACINLGSACLAVDIRGLSYDRLATLVRKFQKDTADSERIENELERLFLEGKSSDDREF